MHLWNSRISIVSIAVILCCGQALARIWTDSTGKHKIEGEFVKLADGKVDIRRDDGKLARIPLEKLSEDDQAFVKNTTKPAAQESPFSVTGGDEKPIAKRETAGDTKNTQTVFAEGVGTSKEEALKDAFRAAVRQVVGEVVDGETLVKNEELVKDRVLTYSDGFIPEHKELSAKHENGIYRVSIRANVQRRSVIMKLKAANITTKEIAGQSLYGSIVTQIGAEKDAAAMVAKALEGFPDNYMEARVVGEPKVLGKTDSEATLVINVEFSPSLSAYKAFAVKLCQTLEGIGKAKGEFTSMMEKRFDADHEEIFYLREATGGWFGSVVRKWMPELMTHDDRAEVRWPPKGFGLAVATLVSKDSSRMDWKYYILDEAVDDAVVSAFIRQASCKISFVDAEGEPVSVDRFDPRANDVGDPANRVNKRSLMQGLLMTALVPEGDSMGTFSETLYNKPKPKLAFVAPAFFCGPDINYMPKVTIPRKVKLSLDELKSVAKVKCDISFRAAR